MDPLEQLHDISLAEPISWWPLAIGWWISAAVIVSIIGILLAVYFRKRKQNKGFRAALRELESIEQTLTGEVNDLFLINALLKRCIRFYGHDSNVNAMHGAEWALYLSTWLPEKYRQRFEVDTKSIFEQLFQNIDNPRDDNRSRHFISAARLWLKHARPTHHNGEQYV